jgi:putative transposase
MTLAFVSYERHRFPFKIITHAVWLYFRLSLSLRLVDAIRLERGVFWLRYSGRDHVLDLHST